jgi:hypothetical protein
MSVPKPEHGHSAIHLSTTGSDFHQLIAAIALWSPNAESELYLTTHPQDEADKDLLERELWDRTNGLDTQLHIYEDTTSLLFDLRTTIQRKSNETNDATLLTYDTDDEFDTQAFLRGLCIKTDSEWPLTGFSVSNLFPSIQNRVNTTVSTYGTTRDVTQLSKLHELFSITQHSVASVTEKHPWYQELLYDPLSESMSVAHAHSQSEYLHVLLHTLAQAHRIWELGVIAREYGIINE